VIAYLIALAIGGLIIGALGRLAIPGPNPMSIGQTILVGIGGSFIGGLIGRVLFRGNLGGILAVAAAAGIVYFMQRRDA
jgi:uncharacterized membrane protein YeaQ/YmgE (transglycosylase-associated protein family)